MNNLEPLKIVDINKDDIINFLNLTSNTLKQEKIKEKINLISQLIGHINQLLVRIDSLINKENLTNITNSLDNINKEFISLKEEDDSDSKIIELNNLYEKTFNLYNNISEETIKTLNNYNIQEYNDLIIKANESIIKFNNLSIDDKVREEVTTIYNNILNSIDSINNLHILISTIDNLSLNSNTNKSKGNETNRSFLLFAKINDQIVKSLYKPKNNLIYACYTLEDDSNYYAIVKSEEEVNILDQGFTNLPNLVLTKDNIIETCKTIIRNAGIYYDLNEYMRYVEKSYKEKMSKEIDEVIVKYKKRLMILENSIRQQLEFIDEIALLVNNKKSSKYPNIVYKDIPLKDYFKDYDKNMDSKTREIERLIVEVLLNDTVISSFETINILKTLYDDTMIEELITSDYTDSNDKPIVNTDDNLVKEIPINKVTTNYEKITNYLNSRVKELNLLIESPKINVTITKDDDVLYKDINTVLDLHTSIVICDKVYKKGQGNYALNDYLKTGNNIKFTSQYGARDLVNTVNRSNYLKLLFENIIKRYLYTHDNKLTNFIDSIITKENIKDIVDMLLEDEELLDYSVTNFDYDYLDCSNDKNKKVNEMLNNKEDVKIVKINDILAKIRKMNSLVD